MNAKAMSETGTRTERRPGSRRRGYVLRALVVLASMALVVAPLTAQDRRGRRGPVDRQEMEQRVRAEMARVIRERLGLTEDESRRLGEVVERFQEERRELWRSEQATRRRVEALMLEGGEDPEEARELLERLVELRVEESRLFEAEQEALLEVLTPTQLLRLHALREQMGRRIRALRGRRPGGDTVGSPIREGPFGIVPGGWKR